MISNENTQTSMMRTSSIASNSTISDKSKLKDKLKSLKNQVKEYQQSEEFKEYKEELKKEEQNKQSLLSSPTSRNTVMSIWDQDWMDEYFQMRTVTWKWWGKECPWKIPCYEQSKVSNWKCLTWCIPNAFAMIFGYYNRRWLYPDLISWIWVWEAPLKNNYYINRMQKELSSATNVYCESDWSWVANWFSSFGAKEYLISKWYNMLGWEIYSRNWEKNNGSRFNKNSLNYAEKQKFIKITKNEIDRGRPFLARVYTKQYKDLSRTEIEDESAHAIVIYWYSTRHNYDDRVNANLGWGPEFSNINFDIGAGTTVYNGSKPIMFSIIWYFTFWIK